MSYQKKFPESNRFRTDHYFSRNKSQDKIQEILNLKHKKKYIEAKEICETILDVDINNSIVNNLLGLIFIELKDLKKAEQYIKKALDINKNDQELLNNLAVVYIHQNEYGLAIKYFKKANNFGYSENISVNLASAYFQNNQLLKSADEYELVLKKNNKVNVYFNLARVYLKLKDKNNAIRIANESFKNIGETAEMYNFLGLVHKLFGNLKTAVTTFQKAVKKFPNHYEIHNNLGIAQYEMGYLNLACRSFAEAIKIDPTQPDVYVNLGNAEQKLGRIFHAIECFKKALSITERSSAYNNLGNAYGRIGENEKALQCFKKSLDINLTKVENLSFAENMSTIVDSDILSNYLCHLDYIDRFSPKEVFEEHVKASKLFMPKTKKPSFDKDQLSKSDNKLRIGYMSPDFKAHSVSNFFLPIIANHDKSKFEIICYYNDSRTDKVTSTIAAMSNNFKKIFGWTTDQVVEEIKKDKINILVDLGGHFAYNRIPVLARKPAPITVTYLGYPNTTGLPNMDYRFTTDSADPKDISDQYHTEKLIRLKDNFLCYNGPNVYKTNFPPSKINNKIMFGSFNNILKISEFTIKMWSEVLKQVPDSELMIKSSMRINEDVCSVFMKKFARNGIKEDRIKVVQTTNNNAQSLQLYNSMDIALDTFPFNGATTTFEALWMGVPVMTLRGDKHAGRVSTSILDALNMDDCIGFDQKDFIEKCINLANSPEKLEYYKYNLRENLLNSPLTNSINFTRKIEKEYDKMWLNLKK